MTKANKTATECASMMHTNVGDGRLNLACNNACYAPSHESLHHSRRPRPSDCPKV